MIFPLWRRLDGCIYPFLVCNRLLLSSTFSLFLGGCEGEAGHAADRLRDLALCRAGGGEQLSADVSKVAALLLRPALYGCRAGVGWVIGYRLFL